MLLKKIPFDRLLDYYIELKEKPEYLENLIEVLKRKSNMAKKMISEYGGMEKYPSKAAKAKHEKKESNAVEKKEKMAYMAKKSKK